MNLSKKLLNFEEKIYGIGRKMEGKTEEKKTVSEETVFWDV